MIDIRRARDAAHNHTAVYMIHGSSLSSLPSLSLSCAKWPSAFAETATDTPYAETNVCRTRSVKGLVERVLAALLQQHVAQKLELHICGQSGPERHGRHRLGR